VHLGCALVVPRIDPAVLHHEGKNCMENTLETIGSSMQHPDAAWLSKIEGWVVAGTLTFSAQLNQPDHQLILNSASKSKFLLCKRARIFLLFSDSERIFSFY
jgi:alpha-mannosidase